MITDASDGLPRVLLVSPPWTNLNEPSLGLALLSAVLDQQGIPCRVMHLNLFMLEFMRSDTYAALARMYALNDFLFSGVLDPYVTGHQRRLLREKCSELVALSTIDHRQYGGISGVADQLLELRSHVVPEWIEHKVQEIVDWRPTLVGFTCMFDQTIASAAISCRLKAKTRDCMVVFGGYAVRSPTGEMLLDAFPWIDAICTGEGEPCIGELARASTRTQPDLSEVPNLLFRSCGKPTESPRANAVNMDELPTPNFDHFYQDVRTLSSRSRVDVSVDRLPIENSRGCWWGQVHHCVFCGIHDDDLKYRSRRAERVLGDLDNLNERYGVTEFRFADYILPHSYYSTLLPRLIERGSPYRFKCELKANINDAKARLLSTAGFVEVQPGIESFSSRTLRGMVKGVSAVQNVHLLLLGRRYGIVILYNVLYGLPDDDPADYERMLTHLPLLAHLDPPSSWVRIQVTRFAPLQVNPGRFGIAPAQHESSYELIFSDSFLESSGFDLDRYCYMYEHPFEPSPRLMSAYRELENRCESWFAAHCEREIELLYEPDPSGGVCVHDTRTLPAKVHHLTTEQANILRLLETPHTVSSVTTTVTSLPAKDIEFVIERLRSLGLVFQDGDKLVSLALPRCRTPSRKHWWDNYETRWSDVVGEPRTAEYSTPTAS